MPTKFCFLFFLTLLVFGLQAQTEKNKKLFWTDTSQTTVYSDTSHFFVTDSFTINLGQFREDVPSKHYKKFKYIGTDSLMIIKAWTNDPHFICGHPQGFLIPGKEYVIRFCFFFKGKIGKFRKGMGFRLSNGESLNFYFTGTILPKP